LGIYAKNEAGQPQLVLPATKAKTALDKSITALSEFSLRDSSDTGLYEISYANKRLVLNKVVMP